MIPYLQEKETSNFTFINWKNIKIDSDSMYDHCTNYVVNTYWVIFLNNVPPLALTSHSVEWPVIDIIRLPGDFYILFLGYLSKFKNKFCTKFSAKLSHKLICYVIFRYFQKYWCINDECSQYEKSDMTQLFVRKYYLEYHGILKWSMYKNPD